MSYLLGTFKPWADANNIKLTKDDIFHIQRRIGHFSRIEQRNILKLYVNEWRIGVSECNDEIRKMNAGRARANNWMRENFEK